MNGHSTQGKRGFQDVRRNRTPPPTSKSKPPRMSSASSRSDTADKVIEDRQKKASLIYIAQEKARRQEEERLEEEARMADLFEQYLDAADSVWLMEFALENNAPKKPDELWTQRFIVSLRYLDEMRDRRDRLFDELHKDDIFLLPK